MDDYQKEWLTNNSTRKRRSTLGQETPIWVPDEEIAACTNCNTTFNMLRRRHHCRSCGKIFCNRCSSYSLRLPNLHYLSPVRVCTTCFTTLNLRKSKNIPDDALSIKLAVLGDSKAGKTHLIRRFVAGEFLPSLVPTEGGTFHSKAVTTASGQAVDFEIWDLSGQERYWTMASGYFQEADVILLVYDITSKKPLDAPEMWLERVREERDDALFALVGTKYDVPPTEQRVSPEEVQAFVDLHRIPFHFATSAKLNMNVIALFQGLAEFFEEDYSNAVFPSHEE